MGRPVLRELDVAHVPRLCHWALSAPAGATQTSPEVPGAEHRPGASSLPWLEARSLQICAAWSHAARMHKGRLEAFSDGVLAIIITIMVLELEVPHAENIEALAPLLPVLLSYTLSFIYVGIYWNNHHHIFQATERITGGVLWANLHLLFWLSLFPFVTDWMGETRLARVPTVCYGAVLLMAAIAYKILQTLIIRGQGNASRLARAVGSDGKGKLSPVLYALAIGAAFVRPYISAALYVIVALMWLVPDRRIERSMVRD
jgi:TMEM175 potassium channel family protein